MQINRTGKFRKMQWNAVSSLKESWSERWTLHWIKRTQTFVVCVYHSVRGPWVTSPFVRNLLPRPLFDRWVTHLSSWVMVSLNLANSHSRWIKSFDFICVDSRKSYLNLYQLNIIFTVILPTVHEMSFWGVESIP